jgi:hypothetical protein
MGGVTGAVRDDGIGCCRFSIDIVGEMVGCFSDGNVQEVYVIVCLLF